MISEKLLLSVIDEISMGPFGSNIKVDNFISSGVPVLNGANLADKKLTERTFNFISEEKANSLGKANARPGDVVITHRGTLGQVSYIPENSKFDRYVISQSQFRVKFKSEINPIYITYLFHTEYGQKKLLSFKNHVGVPALAQATSNFKCLSLRMHDKISQDKIANILSAFDEKIELNNKINTQLEFIAKTLYNYWFLQFDFPDKKGRPYKSSGGRMVWNEELKREIPLGWEAKKLFDIISLLARGVSPNYTENGGIVVLNQKCIRNKSIDFSFGRRHDNTIKSVQSKLIQLGDVLVNSTGVGTLGRLAMVKRLEEPLLTVDSHVTIVRIDEQKVNTFFAGYSLTEKQSEIENLGEGSTGQTELSRDQLGNIKIIIPINELQVAFEKIVKTQFEKIAINEKENEKLAELRDWLLPMLMNGQVSADKIDQEKDLLSAAFVPRIPKNKAAFAKQVLAGKIVSLFKNDKHFTHIKFQKMQFLAEHIAEADLNLNYYFQTAGPYDNRFMHTIADSFRKAKWYNEKNFKFLPLENEKEIDKYYTEYFAPVSSQLAGLFKLLAKATVAETEIIATVYAVWNNRLILKQPVKEPLLIEDFYNWSDRKGQYTKKQILDALQWIKKNGFTPKGFGKEIKRAKAK